MYVLGNQFQFLDGSIKRKFRIDVGNGVGKFQFLDGSIKRILHQLKKKV